MAIQSGDVKLLRSVVMADVVEGGGAPTSLVIQDGLSNAIFPDISELDRAGGRVSLRKTFVSVQTDDTDLYFGVNVIVAEPPADPRVSVTLFSNKLTFDTRFDAQKRIEAYLNRGPEMQPFLFENHIAGQRVIQYFQRPEEEIINVGHTWVIIQNENLPTEILQYVRATRVTSVVKLFYDEEEKKDYLARVVSIEISDALRYDFAGSPQTKKFTRQKNLEVKDGRTKYPGALTRDTVVADAGTYVGVVPLTDPARVGDFTIHGSSIYTQLVPSAQTETPIADTRPTQQAFVFVGTGGALVQNISMGFTTTQNLFIGGMIKPGTLTIVRDGITLTDKGQKLMGGGIQVGTVDYENGSCTLLNNVFGSNGGMHVVTYVPAAKYEASLKSTGYEVTQETRSLSYVRSLGPAPEPGTLTVAYMVGRRWYLLRDYGGGELRGLDSDYGAGTINYQTGTVSVTCGALPDVGSSLIFQWVEAGITIDATVTPLRRFNRLATPFNTNGQISTGRGGRGIQPSGLTITWQEPHPNNTGAPTDKFFPRQCTDNGFGTLIGDAMGTVDYSGGLIWWSPHKYPPKDTLIGIDINGGIATTSAGIQIFNGIISANIQPKSVHIELSVLVQYFGKQGSKSSSSSTAKNRSAVAGWEAYYSPQGINSFGSVSSSSSISGVISTVARTLSITDNGLGKLVAKEPGQAEYELGTINYATGEINFVDLYRPPSPDVLGPMVSFSTAGAKSTGSNVTDSVGFRYWGTSPVVSTSDSSAQSASWQERWDDCWATLGGTRTFVIQAQTISARYRTAGITQDSLTIPLIAAVLEVDLAPYHSIGVMRFTMGEKDYLGSPSGALITDINPNTGKGITSGELIAGAGVVTVTRWTPLAGPEITNYRCAQVAPGDGPTSPGFTTDLIFRCAAAPIRPGSIQLSGRMMDGTNFSVTAGVDGKINGSRCIGTVDYEVGLIKIWFVKKSFDADTAIVGNYSFLGAGFGTYEIDLANVSTLRYNAVSYSYLPLDAQLLGIDPVRLPSDGRVPIFRPGGFGVVGHTGRMTKNVTNGMVVNCNRVRLSRVRVVGADKLVINSGYTVDLEEGILTFTDVAPYVQPVTIEHRIEDMAVIRDTQINGDVTFTRPVTHDYPLGSFLSSALIAGDRFARVQFFFDQTSWDGSWSDDLKGGVATGTFNTAQFPVRVTNRGAVTERWVIRFTSPTAFDVIGEHVGVLGNFNKADDCKPVNPASNVPYFTIPALGWGGGWSPGNIVRMNTIGSEFPVWVVRTVQQGPETVASDSFTLLTRGDIDTP